MRSVLLLYSYYLMCCYYLCILSLSVFSRQATARMNLNISHVFSYGDVLDEKKKTDEETRESKVNITCIGNRESVNKQKFKPRDGRRDTE